MIKLTKLTQGLKQLASNGIPSLKLQPMEIFKDSESNKPYVIVTPIGRYRPHNIHLEEIITQKNLLKKLNTESLCYVFHAYGVLQASQNNNLFSLVEFMPMCKHIKVKNLITLETEEWTNEQFELDYALLDKSSLKNAIEFFSSFARTSEQNTKDINISCESSIGTLRLIK